MPSIPEKGDGKHLLSIPLFYIIASCGFSILGLAAFDTVADVGFGRCARCNLLFLGRIGYGLHDERFQLLAEFGIVLEQSLRGVAALRQARVLVTKPATALLDDIVGHTQVDNLTGLGNALTEHDVELRLAEGRRHLVLDHFDADLVADDLVAILDGGDPADIQSDGGVELQGVALMGASP